MGVFAGLLGKGGFYINAVSEIPNYEILPMALSLSLCTRKRSRTEVCSENH